MIYGADVSHYQNVGQVQQAITVGGFVFVKATEGVWYVDPMHDADVTQIRAAGKHVGHYHFARTTANWDAEARYFLAHAGVRPGDAVAIDMEATDGDWKARVTYLCGWLDVVHSVTAAQPLIYVNGSWLSGIRAAATGVQTQYLSTFPLWIAWPGIAGQVPVEASTWKMHQYSTAAGFDHDLLKADWASFAIPTPAPPTPTPVLEALVTPRIWEDPAGVFWAGEVIAGKPVISHITSTADKIADMILLGIGDAGVVAFNAQQLADLRPYYPAI